MPLPWVRLDTAFPYNPKLLAMVAEKDGHRAGLVYVCSLGYSGAHGTDGFIPKEALPFIHGRPVDADRLVRNGFWRDSARRVAHQRLDRVPGVERRDAGTPQARPGRRA